MIMMIMTEVLFLFHFFFSFLFFFIGFRLVCFGFCWFRQIPRRGPSVLPNLSVGIPRDANRPAMADLSHRSG